MVLDDLTGMKFGKLIVLYRSYGSRSTKKTWWMCKCECGIEKTINADHLTRKFKPSKSCGCTSKRKGMEHPNFRGYESISGNWWYNHIEREKTQKSRQKIEVSITPEYAWKIWTQQQGKCKLTDVELIIHNDPKNNTASIDRIDSCKGYISGNIQWVHKHINMMKRTYSQEYFIDMCLRVTNKYIKEKEQIINNSGDRCEIT